MSNANYFTLSEGFPFVIIYLKKTRTVKQSTQILLVIELHPFHNLNHDKAPNRQGPNNQQHERNPPEVPVEIPLQDEVETN